MRPAFGDWRSLVAHFVRDEGVGGSNPLSPTKFEKPAQRAGFFASAASEDENLRGQEVRLERSERTLRQQRTAGRATKWRVILYHRPNSKSLLNEQAFLLLRPVRMRTPKVRFRSRRPAQAQRRRAPSAVSRPKTASKSQKTSLPPFPASCSLFCDIFHCIFLSMNRSFFAKLMAEYSIFRCAF